MFQPHGIGDTDTGLPHCGVMVSLGASVFGGVIGTGGATLLFLLLPQAVRRASAIPAARTPAANRFIHLIVEFLPLFRLSFGGLADFYDTPPPPKFCQVFDDISEIRRKLHCETGHFDEEKPRPEGVFPSGRGSL